MNNQTNEVQLSTGSPKKQWIIVGVAVGLTALIVGGGVYVWQRAEMKKSQQALQQQIDSLQQAQEAVPTPTETPRPTPDALAGWSTYRNEEHSYQIQHPSTATINSSDAACVIVESGVISVIINSGSSRGACAVGPGLGLGAVRFEEQFQLDGRTYTASGFRYTQEAFQEQLQEQGRAPAEYTGGTHETASFSLNGPTEFRYSIISDTHLSATELQQAKEIVRNIIQSYKPLNREVSASDLKTYTNAQFGFSFQYPADWYAFENNALYEKMCQTQFKLESPTNDFSPCLDSELVAVVSTLNGFCTKGGCVGPDLKKRELTTPIAKISISTLTPSRERDLMAAFNNPANKTQKSRIGIADVYYHPAPPDAVSPNLTSLFTIGNTSFEMSTASGTGTEEQEIQVMRELLSTLTANQ